MSEKRFSFSHNELAETLLSEGEQVIVTARKPKTIQHFAKKLSSDSLMPEIRRDEEGHD